MLHQKYLRKMCLCLTFAQKTILLENLKIFVRITMVNNEDFSLTHLRKHHFPWTIFSFIIKISIIMFGQSYKIVNAGKFLSYFHASFVLTSVWEFLWSISFIFYTQKLLDVIFFSKLKVRFLQLFLFITDFSASYWP